MKHLYRYHSDETARPNGDMGEGHRDPRGHRGEHHGGPRGHHGGGRHGRHGPRAFDYGELRLLALAMIAEQPRHGYELMKAIEERMGGSYSPSPGVMYPTLSWLDDMGYATVEVEAPGRKRYRIAPEGEAFLAANKAALEALFARIGAGGGEGGRAQVPAPVVRAMENLKLALLLRLRRGPLDQPITEAIAAALDAAAQTVERS